MTRRKQLIAGCAVLCLLILVASWFLVATPRKQAVADLRTQAAAQEITNQTTRTQLAVLQDVAARLPQAQQQAAALSQRVPSSPELVQLIRQLTDAAKHSGTELTSITPTKPTALVVAPGLSGIGLTLVVKGDYPSVEEYESQLEDLKRSFIVTGLTVAGSGGKGSSTSTSTGDILTQTITGQVLVSTPAPSVGAAHAVTTTPTS